MAKPTATLTGAAAGYSVTHPVSVSVPSAD